MMMRGGIAGLGVGLASGLVVLGDAPPPLLLADDTRRPVVSISWPTRDGGEVSIAGKRPYRSPGDAELLGRNIHVYIALGGTRLEWGQGHPDGAIIRVGLYKAQPRRWFFEDLADGAEITVSLTGVFMNQPVVARPETGLMHVQYMQADLVACGLGDDAKNLFVTACVDDPLLALLPAENVRAGSLDGGAESEGHGTIEAVVGEDGSVSITWRFPYALLRHLQDPYQRTTPGGFFEPQHFHLELELVSASPGETEEGP